MGGNLNSILNWHMIFWYLMYGDDLSYPKIHGMIKIMNEGSSHILLWIVYIIPVYLRVWFV